MTPDHLPPLHLTHVVAAPVTRVFQAWTQPALMMHWFKPRGFTMLACDVDLRVGGTWRAQMRSPAGREYVHRGTYREIVAPTRLVFTQAWEHEHGQLGPAMLVTVTFTDRGDTTDVTLDQRGFASAEIRRNHAAGWRGAFDLLSTYVAQQHKEDVHARSDCD